MTYFVEEGNRETQKKNPSSTARTFADLLSSAMYSEPVFRETFQNTKPDQQANSAGHLEQQREQRGEIVARHRVARDRVEHASRWAIHHTDPAMQ